MTAQLKAQVGEQVLEVRPVRDGDLGTVVGRVADLCATVPDTAGGVVSARVADPAVPPAVLQRLSVAGVPVAELSLRKPSLDEVFFALTGHRTGDAAPGDRDDTDRSAA